MDTQQPVKVNDTFNVKIISIGSKGDGIAKHQGFVIIVKNGKENKEYKIRVNKVFPKFAVAEILQERSERRTHERKTGFQSSLDGMKEGLNEAFEDL